MVDVVDVDLCGVVDVDDDFPDPDVLFAGIVVLGVDACFSCCRVFCSDETSVP